MYIYIQTYKKDILFAIINGMIFGLGFSSVSQNIDAIPHLNYLTSTLSFGLLSAIGVSVGIFLSKFYKFFFQLAKFGIVGAANTAVDIGIFNLLIYANNDQNTATTIALYKAISFIIAVINSYIWNKYWSFEKKTLDKKAARKEFIQFFSVSIIGWIVNIIITSIVVLSLSTDGAPSTIDANIAAAISSLSVLIWNFLGYKFIVFKK